ncbi:hypothetical protein JCM11251_004667 [Rhodosporidiobolus azoricus]
MLPYEQYLLPPTVPPRPSSKSFPPPTAAPTPIAITTGQGDAVLHQRRQQQQSSYLQQPQEPSSGLATWSSHRPLSPSSTVFSQSITPSTSLLPDGRYGSSSGGGGGHGGAGASGRGASHASRPPLATLAPTPSHASFDSLWAWSDALGGAPMFGSSAAARNAYTGGGSNAMIGGPAGMAPWPDIVGAAPEFAAFPSPSAFAVGPDPARRAESGRIDGGGATGPPFQPQAGSATFSPFVPASASSTFALPNPPPYPTQFSAEACPALFTAASSVFAAPLPRAPTQVPYEQASSAYVPLASSIPPSEPVEASTFAASPHILFPQGSTPSFPSPPVPQPPPPVPFVPSDPLLPLLREDGIIPYSPDIAAKRNPADPYVPTNPNSTTPPRCVFIAAAYRKNLAKIDLTGRRRGSNASTASTSNVSSSSSSSPTSALASPTGPAPKPLTRGKSAAVLPVVCTTCSTPICRLTLRGGCVDTLVPPCSGVLPSSYSYSFQCYTCAPPPPPPSKDVTEKGKKKEEDPLEGEARYETMISGAVDRYLGLDPEKTDSRPKAAGWGKVVPGFVAAKAGAGLDEGDGECKDGQEEGKTETKKRKGKKRAASEMAPVREGVLVCDVCNRDLAAGRLTLAPSTDKGGGKESEGAPVTATAEVVCWHCEGRYVRCSDCGGGGAGKGSGRWRCKELFVDGRKTCLLSHGRPPPVASMEFDVHHLPALPPAQLPDILKTCQRFFFRTAFLTAAIPEMIESPSPLARSFDELECVAADYWSVFEDIIRKGDEDGGKGQVRRYLAFYWAPPPTQSKKTAPIAPPAAPSNASPGTILKEDKVLSGLILAEHDLQDGNLHLCFHLPFSVGEAGLALGRLTHILCERAQKELDAVNKARAGEGKEEWPRLTTVWTVRFNKRDSRLMTRATRRDWTSLDKYLAKYPDVKLRNFPPYRPFWLSPDLSRGWWIYAGRAEGGEAKAEVPNSDLGGMSI